MVMVNTLGREANVVVDVILSIVSEIEEYNNASGFH